MEDHTQGGGAPPALSPLPAAGPARCLDVRIAPERTEARLTPAHGPCTAEVVVVAEAQVSAPPDTVPQNEPPPLAPPDPGADVHKDADGSHAQQGVYYSQGQPVMGNPPMVVMSPYHSMVSAHACIVCSTMHVCCAYPHN